MLNWLWKKLGYHVCEKCTQWEIGEHYSTITPVIDGIPMKSLATTVSRTIQSRYCTTCGKVQVREVK